VVTDSICASLDGRRHLASIRGMFPKRKLARSHKVVDDEGALLCDLLCHSTPGVKHMNWLQPGGKDADHAIY